MYFRLQVVSLQEVPRRVVFPETRLPLNTIFGNSVSIENREGLALGCPWALSAERYRLFPACVLASYLRVSK